MELAFSIEISISEFWEMTPYELSIAYKGYSKQKEREAEEYRAKLKNERVALIEQALLISRWVWKKEITQKDIDEAIGEKKAQKEMSPDAMLAMVKMLNAQLGGEVRVNGKTESNN